MGAHVDLQGLSLTEANTTFGKRKIPCPSWYLSQRERLFLTLRLVPASKMRSRKSFKWFLIESDYLHQTLKKWTPLIKATWDTRVQSSIKLDSINAILGGTSFLGYIDILMKNLVQNFQYSKSSRQRYEHKVRLVITLLFIITLFKE
jgi:hypothetical protein